MIPLFKKRAVKNPDLLNKVRERPCIICGRYPSDAHHITTRACGGGDTGDNLANLCHEHHIEIHTIGPFTFVLKYKKYRRWLEEHERWDMIPLKR